ncbi:tripartite tricarboxylate transporter substrate-binding protein [uncultured Ramlibacter sp.]|uniref:tripartite tricarboxylate transporter substrate-binding protein n=1 Tax=uncultured Ramlibacter sp. TaxID=260755 RepID=UPI00262F257D|nr:tripartite tricarboxylate transporter substrate-binding protein [uncultured Ramlibacter sp.]
MAVLSRRAFTRIAMAVPASTWLRHGLAQTNVTIGKLLVGYPAGGTLDTTARQLTEAWRKSGRQYIVDNRVGAAGRIANSQLKRERPDGNTLLCTHSSALTIFPHVYTRLMYDVLTDFAPVSSLAVATCALAVSSAVPATVKTLADYLVWVRSFPSGSAYASPAAGSMAHFLGFQLAETAGVKLQHVGYRGSAPALQDLMGGQIPAYFGFVADFLPYMQQGKIRILGVAGEKRSPFVSGVPTFAEQGFPTIRGGETYGVFAPPGTPEPTIKVLQESIVVAGKDAGLRASFDQVGLEVFTQTSQEFGRQLQRERDAWGPVVRASGFRSED